MFIVSDASFYWHHLGVQHTMDVALLWSDYQTDEASKRLRRCVMVLLVKTQCFHCVKYMLNFVAFILNINFSAFNSILFVGILFFIHMDF